MNVYAKSAAIAGAVLVAGTLGASYYIGGHIEQAFHDTAARWSEREGFSLQVTRYERGLFSAQAHTVWTMDGEEEPYEVQAQHHIRHAPWLWPRAAIMHTDFALPTDSDAAIHAALGEQPVLTWAASFDWERTSSHELQAPELDIQFDDQSAMQWGGLQAQWDMDASATAAKGWLKMPLARIVDINKDVLEAKDVRLDLDVRQEAQYSFWDGPVQLQVGQLRMLTADGHMPLQLQGLGMQLQSTTQGGVVDISVSSRVDAAKWDHFDSRQLVMEMHFKRIDADWLQFMHSWVNSDDDSGNVDVLRNLPLLLAQNPEIALTRLAMDTDDGTSEISAKLSYHSEAEAPLDPGTQLHAQFRATLPRSVMEAILSQRVRSEYLDLLERMEQDMDESQLQVAVANGVGKRLHNLVEQGIIEPQGQQLSTQLDYMQGELRLNGKAAPLHILSGLGGAL